MIGQSARQRLAQLIRGRETAEGRRVGGIRGMMQRVREAQEGRQAAPASRPTGQEEFAPWLFRLGRAEILDPMQGQPAQYATGGMVTGVPKIPSLMELSQPNFDLPQAQISTAPFDAANPLVAMSSTVGPAFGGMPQDVYSWTPPQVAGGQAAQVPRQPPAQVTGTSAYTPFDSSVFGNISIPNASQISAGIEAQRRQRQQEQALLGQMGDMRLSFEEELGLLGEQLTGAQGQLSETQRRLLSTEEQARLAQAQQEQEYRSQMEQMRGMQAEELMRRQQEFEAQLAQQREAAAAAQQQLSGFESSFDQRLQQGIMSELQRRQQEQAQQEAERRERAMAASAQAEAAERARQAQLAEQSRRNSMIMALTGGFFGELPIYNPNEMVSVTRLVDGGRGGQYVEQVPRSQYDLEQARARAYEAAWNA